MRRAVRLFLTASATALATAAEAGETITYSYDPLGRLSATASSGTVNNGVAIGIAYDPAGNRSAYAVAGAPPAPPSPPPPPPPPPPPRQPSNQLSAPDSDGLQAQQPGPEAR